MRTVLVLFFCAALACSSYANNEYWLETESFTHLGGWTHTSQYMDQMGSPYIQAHGLGQPVADAYTDITLPAAGKYHVWVRTYNWTSPWTNRQGAGQFTLQIDGQTVSDTLGCQGNKWEWQYAGCFRARQCPVRVALHDLTGFDGRCDALYFSTSRHPDLSDTPAMRKRLLSPTVKDQGSFDFIVIGGGLAGMCAAIAAARLGLQVALIQDRPVLGGNNSSEIRVHTSGASCKDPYPALGLLLREFGYDKVINGDADARRYNDSLKLAVVQAEARIALFLNEHVNAVEMDGKSIRSITSQNTYTGALSTYSAPLFADCTGDACVGYLAGADYEMASVGMGASVLWNTVPEPNTFPLFEYGLTFTDESVRPITHGEWQWETGMNKNQITQAEYIRDYGMLVAYSNWSYLTHRYALQETFGQRNLHWVSTQAGKRESRRLMGDYILTRTDIIERDIKEDATVTTNWPIDLHYPDTANSRFFPGEEFVSRCEQERIALYPIPYRCFYSRNIPNLFMAGRDISVTHEALGTIRVMRTTAMMGEVVGMAASICHQHQSLPRSVYQLYFPELQALMQKGVGDASLPDNQNFHIGRYLK